jgi:heme-degrading monooxygenase HmoA
MTEQTPILVIFEVLPKPEHRQAYLDIAENLKQHLSTIDGFISVERFKSLTDDNKLLSLSRWRDEKAVETWRQQHHHKNAQQQGRQSIFKDYHIQVAAVVRDYGMRERDQAPSQEG